ncbi:MAG: TIGR04372 family glycosyltransferase, partial [Rhodospirillales bacterium]
MLSGIPKKSGSRRRFFRHAPPVREPWPYAAEGEPWFAAELGKSGKGRKGSSPITPFTRFAPSVIVRSLRRDRKRRSLLFWMSGQNLAEKFEVADSTVFDGAPKDALRLGRWLVAQKDRAITPHARLAYAKRAHAIERSDVALELLEAFVDSCDDAEALATHARVCIDLLRLGEAAKSLARYRRAFGSDSRSIALEFDAARAGRVAMPTTIDDRSLATVLATAPLEDVELLWRSIPFASLPMAFAARALAKLLPCSPRLAIRFFARWAAAACAQAILYVATSILLTVLRNLNPGRSVHIAVMGRFTPLSHLVDGLDPVLRNLAADGGPERHRLYVLYFGGYPNATIFDLFTRHCNIIEVNGRIPRKIASLLRTALRRTNRLVVLREDFSAIGKSMQSNPAVLKFEAREESELAARAESLGIDTSRNFIVFGLRDMAYYRLYGGMSGKTMNARRASMHHRCPPLVTYVAAAQAWAEAGHQVVRMGLRVSEPLPSGLDSRVIDYASGARDDALDAFLFSKCWFMIAGDTGMFSGAAAFDRPSV